MDKRICCTCKVEKPLEEFYRNAKGAFGRHSRCISCTKIGLKATYKKLGKNHYLKATYGITEQDMKDLHTSQNGKCAICNTDINLSERNKRSACVDHCHTTGKVRALLCNHCNRGLGMFLDNPQLLRNAATYLEETK